MACAVWASDAGMLRYDESRRVGILELLAIRGGAWSYEQLIEWAHKEDALQVGHQQEFIKQQEDLQKAL